MKIPKVSIIIRAYNEEAALSSILDELKRQDYPKSHFEIVVVDNGSIDNTALIAEQFGAKVVSLSQEEFSYPKSSNAGIAVAIGDIVIITVAHALPIGKHWIKSVSKHFDNPKVAGVYGPVIPGRWTNVAEFSIAYPAYWLSLVYQSRRIFSAKMGVMGATNCALRRDLWQKHHFDEKYAAGAEDYAWAKWAISQGYILVLESKFVVKHTHNLRLLAYWKQWKLWKSLMNHPRPFDKKELSFRKDMSNYN